MADLFGPVLTTAEVAKMLRVSQTQVRRLNLPAVEVGRGRWRYVRDQVIAEMARRGERGDSLVKRPA